MFRTGTFLDVLSETSMKWSVSPQNFIKNCSYRLLRTDECSSFWFNLSCVTNENQLKKVVIRHVISCKRVWKYWNFLMRNFVQFQIDLEEVTLNLFLDIFSREGEIGILFSTFLHEVMIKYFLAVKYKGSHFEFFVQKVVRGNAVQILSNFPAKSLSI